MIELTVKTLDARNHEFSVDDEGTVGDLKNLILERIGLAVDVQRLIFRGRVLSDATKLSELDVGGKVVHLVEREPPRGVRESSEPSDRQQRGHPRLAGLGGPFTQQQMENVLLEAIGLQGGPNTGIRGLGGEDTTPRIGHTLLRLNVVRRMQDVVASNLRALDEMAECLPSLSDEVPTSPTATRPMERRGAFRAYRTNSAPDINLEVGLSADDFMEQDSDTMATDQAEEIQDDTASGGTEEWADASDDTPSLNTSSLGVQATVQTNTASTNTTEGTQSESRASSEQREQAQPADWDAGQDMEDRTQRASQQMAAALHHLAALQVQLSRHLHLTADMLVQTHVAGSERMCARQRMVRRVTDTMHNMSHIYHALSDVELTLATPQPRCLSVPPPRRITYPIQTQINVLSNRRRQAGAAQAGQSEASVVTVSPGRAQDGRPDAQQPSARQPTVHVDIRPEPLSYQVEIETRLPFTFALNNRQEEALRSGNAAANNSGGASGGNAGAAQQPQTTPGGQQRHLIIAGPFPFGNGGAADLITSVVQSALSHEFANANNNGQTANNNTRPSAQSGNSRAGNSGSAGNNSGSAGNNSGSAGNNSGSAGNNSGSANNNSGSANNNIGSASNSSGSANNNIGSASNSSGSAGNSSGSAGNNNGSANNNGEEDAAGSQRRFTARQRVRRRGRSIHATMFTAPARLSIFDRFLPCRYDHAHRSRARTRMDERMSETIAAARATARRTHAREAAQDAAAEPSLPALMNALRGFSVTDFIDVEHHMPGENWIIDMLMIFARNMTATELMSAWRAASGAVNAVHGELRSYMRSTLVRSRPDNAARALAVYQTLADSIEQQNRDAREWVEAAVGVNPRVDLERSIRTLLRARVPQILQEVSEPDGEQFAPRFVALVSRAFVDLCAIVQHAGRERNNTLNVLFRAYVDEFLQHLEPALVRRLMSLASPFVARLAEEVSSPSYVSTIQHYVVARQPQQPQQQQSPTLAQLHRGGFNIGAMRALRPRAVPYSVSVGGASAPPPRAATPPQPPAAPQAPPPVVSEPAPPPNMPSDWSTAIRRDAARQRIAGAERTRFSDAYLSGAPPRKRKLLTQDRPDIATMLQDCIREAAASRALPADAEALVSDAGVRRAYERHIRGLARARVGASPDWSRERYPASYHYLQLEDSPRRRD